MIRRAILSLGLLVSLGPAGAQELTTGPYLQSQTADSIIVAWETDVPTPSTVRWGAGALDQRTHDPIATTRHALRIPGLAPGTTYTYTIVDDATTLASGPGLHFRAAPAIGDTIRLWVVGDSGTGWPRQHDVNDAMKHLTATHRPDAMLHMGDMAYPDGTASDFKRGFMHAYADLLPNVPVWTAIGNHEGHSSVSADQSGPYFDTFVLPRGGEAGGAASGTEAYYSFDYGPAHIVVLDSEGSDRSPDGPMLQWLRADLEVADRPWLIAMWHHPPYTQGSHNSDTMLPLIQMREWAVPILEAAGADLILAGHSHRYERSCLIEGAYDTPTVAEGHMRDAGDGRIATDGPYQKVDGPNSGTVYVVSGHGGTNTVDSGDHPVICFSETANGSVLLDIEDNIARITNIRADGIISDTVTLMKGPAIVLDTPDGGQFVTPGTIEPIIWYAEGLNLQTVRLELSTDGGQNWALIAEAPNTGRFMWQVPAEPSAEALIRVRAPNAMLPADTSASTFEIRAAERVELVPWRAAWRYNYPIANTALADWADLDFDDAGWTSGAGDFGRSRSPFGRPPRSRLLSARRGTFFRRDFEVDAAVLGDAELRVHHDGGFIVWLNGVQIADGQMTEPTEAGRSAPGGWVDQVSTRIIDGGLIQAGHNVIAVWTLAPDGNPGVISFDLNFEAVLGRPKPAVRLDPQSTLYSSNWSRGGVIARSADAPAAVIAISDDLGANGALALDLVGGVVFGGRFKIGSRGLLAYDAIDLRRRPERDLPGAPDLDTFSTAVDSEGRVLFLLDIGTSTLSALSLGDGDYGAELDRLVLPQLATRGAGSEVGNQIVADPVGGQVFVVGGNGGPVLAVSFVDGLFEGPVDTGQIGRISLTSGGSITADPDGRRVLLITADDALLSFDADPPFEVIEPFALPFDVAETDAALQYLPATNAVVIGGQGGYVFDLESGTAVHLDSGRGRASSISFTAASMQAPLPAPSDVDGDGVPDATDGCPEDPAKVAPGACGCGVEEGCAIVEDAALPDAALPDAALPEIPDAASPDAASPDAVLPEMPDAASPDTDLPDAASPDVASPDAASPDVASPDAASPDAASPEREPIATPNDADCGGCSTRPPAEPTWPALLVVLALLIPRRHRRLP